MFSLSRMLIGVAIYMVYLFGIIALIGQIGPALFVVLLFAGVAVFLVAIFTGWLTTPGNYKHIMAYGKEATATILAINDTGVTINNSPYVKLRLRVQPSDDAAYETTINVAVSRLAIPSVGDTLTVKYDPAKPHDVIVP